MAAGLAAGRLQTLAKAEKLRSKSQDDGNSSKQMGIAQHKQGRPRIQHSGRNRGLTRKNLVDRRSSWEKCWLIGSHPTVVLLLFESGISP